MKPKYFKWIKFLIIFFVLYFVYAFPYYVMKHYAVKFSQKYQVQGFYFVTPLDENADDANETLEYFYTPLIFFDKCFPGNKSPAKPPFRGFTKQS